MKFLLALTVLATTATAFAGDKIKCYEPAQQGEEKEVAYVLVERENTLHVVYPKKLRGPLTYNEQTQCLTQVSPVELDHGYRLTLCEGAGQRWNGLVPIEAEVGRHEETVYCEREISDWFETDMETLY